MEGLATMDPTCRLLDNVGVDDDSDNVGVGASVGVGVGIGVGALDIVNAASSFVGVGLLDGTTVGGVVVLAFPNANVAILIGADKDAGGVVLIEDACAIDVGCAKVVAIAGETDCTVAEVVG